MFFLWTYGVEINMDRTDDYEYVTSFSDPSLCLIYRRYSGKDPVAKVRVFEDGRSHCHPQMPYRTVEKAKDSIYKTLEYLQNTKERT